MPCDQVQINRVSLDAQFTNLDLLASALTAMRESNVNYISREGACISFFKDGVNYIVKDGVLSAESQRDLDGTPELLAQIKRAYSGEVVKHMAKKNGWQVKQVAAYQYQIIRRG